MLVTSVAESSVVESVDHGLESRAVSRLATRLLLHLTSFETLVALCVLALVFVAVPRSMVDPDIWWHLRNAREMVERHAFVRTDLFSYTAQGSPWIDHEWLSELPFYFGWTIAGANGIYLVTVTVIEAIFAVVGWLCWRASSHVGTASVVTVGAAFLSTVSFGPRTLLFGWLCLVLQLAVLEQFRRRPAAVLALPMLYALWVNLHGSWMIGLTVLLVYSIAGHVRVVTGWIANERFTPRQTRMLLFAWLGIVPALFCNPWGWRLVAYPFNFAFRQTLNVANVQEWHSLDLHSLRGRIVVAAVLLVVGKQMSKPRAWSLSELALLSLGLYSAVSYARFLFLLAILGAPIVARSFARTRPATPLPSNRILNAALLAVVCILLVVSWRRSPGEDPSTLQLPASALETVAHLDPRRRLFNEFAWGGYLEWMQPGRPVFIDSRVDIFEYNGTFGDYLHIIHIEDTLALLDHYRIDLVLFGKDTPLVYLLLHTSGWKLDYDDGRNVLLERTQSLPAHR